MQSFYNVEYLLYDVESTRKNGTGCELTRRHLYSLTLGRSYSEINILLLNHIYRRILALFADRDAGIPLRQNGCFGRKKKVDTT